jgi:hypothetical protein
VERLAISDCSFKYYRAPSFLPAKCDRKVIFDYKDLQDVFWHRDKGQQAEKGLLLT